MLCNQLKKKITQFAIIRFDIYSIDNNKKTIHLMFDLISSLGKVWNAPCVGMKRASSKGGSEVPHLVSNVPAYFYPPFFFCSVIFF